MSSDVISDLGTIAYKFSITELSQLSLSAYDPISNLGSLDGFSSDQVMSPLNHSIIKFNNLLSKDDCNCFKYEIKWFNSD